VQNGREWALAEFADLKKLFVGISIQSDWEFTVERGLRRIKVRFDGNPANPRLIVTQDGVPNPALDLDSGESPTVQMNVEQFDAISNGASYEWVNPRNRESATITEIAELIRDWVGPV